MCPLPGLRGYRHNLIIERQVPNGAPVDYEALPIDGIAQLWFSGFSASGAALNSSPRHEAIGHAHQFIGEATAFVAKVVTVL